MDMRDMPDAPQADRPPTPTGPSRALLLVLAYLLYLPLLAGFILHTGPPGKAGGFSASTVRPTPPSWPGWW